MLKSPAKISEKLRILAPVSRIIYLSKLRGTLIRNRCCFSVCDSLHTLLTGAMTQHNNKKKLRKYIFSKRNCEYSAHFQKFLLFEVASADC